MLNFASFQQAFSGDLVTAHNSNYSQAIARADVNHQKNAMVVAFVKDANDTALAIKYAQDNKLPLAIRCGGLTSRSSSDGLVIDLSKYLNTVRVDKEKKLAFVGGGTLWGAVDKVAIADGLAAVGATAGHVGVGGFLVNGGYGWQTATHGFGHDNIIQATVVTANGSVVTANETENSDLFWGIRGAGSNFGVCTEFVLQLHPQRSTVYGGALIFGGDALEKIVTATERWWSNDPSEKAGMAHFWEVGLDGKARIIVICFYNGSEAEGRSVYQDFFDAGPVRDLTREMPYDEMNASPIAKSPKLTRAVHSRKSDLETIRKIVEKVVEYKKDDFKTAVMLDYIPFKNAKHMLNSRRNNAALLFITWDDDSDLKTDIAASYASELSDILSEGSGDGLTIDNQTSQVFFGENYMRLQQLKAKYDPSLVFNKWFSIEPAI